MERFFIHSIILFFCCSASIVFAQGEMPIHIKEEITYPILDFYPWIDVLPVANPAMTYDNSIDYKVALDLYGRVKDSTAIHPVILEIARTYNLNIVNGVPAEKIQIAAVIHGGLVQAILSEEECQGKYQTSNPNLAALKVLVAVGVKFCVCGQSMGIYNLLQENITSLIKVAVSAKTTFITLDQM